MFRDLRDGTPSGRKLALGTGGRKVLRCGGPAHGQSTQFSEQEWYQLLSQAGYMEELVSNHWQITGEVDTQHAVWLVVDEWGAWHENVEAAVPFVYQFGPASVTRLEFDLV